MGIPLVMMLVAQELQDSRVPCKAVRVSQDATEVITIRVQWGGNDSSIFRVSKHDQLQASSDFVLTEYIMRSVRTMIEERKRANR